MTIDFKKYQLDNGLRILIHHDPSTPMSVVNMLYDVGSKDEDPEMTGFAHLFEHLMFGGTRAVQNFDGTLQRAGGESNAFTNCDITNFYITIPTANIETALWLESDRMSDPDLSEKSLGVQKKVVSEEYRQRYLNQPYGDAMLHLRPLTYKVHPYRWATIGRNIEHIERATLASVKRFFADHYRTDNAVLTIAGGLKPAKAIALVRKWFDNIGPGNRRSSRDLPAEPEKVKGETVVLSRNVPANAIYRSWIVSGRKDKLFNTFDMATDILSGGESGRLYASLVRDKRIFTDINAFVTGETDPGMVLVTGRLSDGTDFATASEAIDQEIWRLGTQPVGTRELQKVKNRYASSFHLANTGILQKAVALAHHELLGDAGEINSMVGLYQSITSEMISEAVSDRLDPSKASTLYYSKNEHEIG